jgi:hypothetical protein
MKRAAAQPRKVEDHQAITLHECIAALLRQFKLEPGVLAGSAYADLHVNDIGLLQVLAEPGVWSVRKIAQALQAPISPSLQHSTASKHAASLSVSDDQQTVAPYTLS